MKLDNEPALTSLIESWSMLTEMKSRTICTAIEKWDVKIDVTHSVLP